MYKRILSICFAFILFILGLNAQEISLPDTVGIGEIELNLTEITYHTSYTWSIDNDNIAPLFEDHTEILGTGTDGYTFDVTSHSHMIYDTLSQQYFAFINSASYHNVSPSLQRLDFGTNPNSTPAVTDFGNPLDLFVSESHSNLESIASALDENGIYHLFITNGGIVHLIFGDGIDHPPTEGERIYEDPEIVMPMQIEIMRQEDEYLLFFGNAYGSNSIMRIDLGTDLNEIPEDLTHVNLPGFSYFPDFPAYYSFIKQGEEWYMLVMLCYSQNVHYRLGFGSDLKNNSPSISTVNFPAYTDNRGVNFIRNHEDFYASFLEWDGSFYKGSFDNDITNVPTISVLGEPVMILGNGFNIMEPYWYNDTLWGLTNTWYPHDYRTVFRVPITTLTGATEVITKYYDPKAYYSFTDPGWHTVTLFCDQGDQAGPVVYRKEVYFDPNRRTSIDTEALSQSIEIYPNPASSIINVVLKQGNFYGDMSWSLTDLGGKIIMSSDNSQYEVESQRLTIPVYDLSKANYILHFNIEDKKISHKITVN